MDRVIIIRYGEIFLKGKNKSYFESLLINNIKHSLKKFKHEFSRSQARYVISNYDGNFEAEIIDTLKKVFGIHSISVQSRFANRILLCRQQIMNVFQILF